MTTDSPAKDFSTMHTFRGKEVAGLIVDPGTAAGIMGTDTMKDFVKQHLKSAGLQYELEPSTSTFSGIDG
eukprot:657643-Pyramimonas_sp.AAC.1